MSFKLEFRELKSKDRVLISRTVFQLGELSRPHGKWVLSYVNNNTFEFDSSDLKQISSKLDEMNGSK